MKYRIKTWEQMLAMDYAILDSSGNLHYPESAQFNIHMKYLCGKTKEKAESSVWDICDWMLEEIPEVPDVYETHKANLYAHGVKLPAMMEVRYCGGKWVERVVFALDDDGYALCNDRNLIRCRPIQTQNVEELKNSAYLGLK